MVDDGGVDGVVIGVVIAVVVVGASQRTDHSKLSRCSCASNRYCGVCGRWVSRVSGIHHSSHNSIWALISVVMDIMIQSFVFCCCFVCCFPFGSI